MTEKVVGDEIVKLAATMKDYNNWEYVPSSSFNFEFYRHKTTGVTIRVLGNGYGTLIGINDINLNLAERELLATALVEMRSKECKANDVVARKKLLDVLTASEKAK